ncbi:MAG: hypothetical protein OEP95_11940 [Myxococcales bacterium]|nr:hypothetical protein [Myxococcales bacterium]
MASIRWVVFFVGLVLHAHPMLAAELQQIVLDDGSSIVAEVRGLEGGVYQLHSPSLGAIRMPQRRVRRIEPRGVAASVSPAASGVSGAQVRELQAQMAGDPTMAASLLQLGELPEMQAVLSDPEIMSAIERGDLSALEANPKIQALMGNATVRDLSQQLSPAE